MSSTVWVSRFALLIMAKMIIFFCKMSFWVYISGGLGNDHTANRQAQPCADTTEHLIPAIRMLPGLDRPLHCPVGKHIQSLGEDEVGDGAGVVVLEPPLNTGPLIGVPICGHDRVYKQAIWDWTYQFPGLVYLKAEQDRSISTATRISPTCLVLMLLLPPHPMLDLAQVKNWALMIRTNGSS